MQVFVIEHILAQSGHLRISAGKPFPKLLVLLTPNVLLVTVPIRIVVMQVSVQLPTGLLQFL